MNTTEELNVEGSCTPNTDVRVSVIMSVRNAESTLRVVFDCLFASNLTNFEVVVVDDASTDGTATLCEEYGITPIRLTQNVGPAAGRNLAVKRARGGTLVFLDSDIAFAPDVLGKLLERLEADPELAGNAVLTSMTPLNKGFYPRYFAIQEYLWMRRLLIGTRDRSLSYISTRCGCLRRQVFEEMGGFSESYKKPSTEDLEFSSRMGDRYLLEYYDDIEMMHCFPDTLVKIFRRYHRNTCEIVQMPPRVRKKATMPYKRDAISRLLLCLAFLSLPIALVQPLVLGVTLALGVAVAVIQHELLLTCWAKEGFLFAVKSWVVYCVLPIPVATGVLAGMLGKWARPVSEKVCEQ